MSGPTGWFLDIGGQQDASVIVSQTSIKAKVLYSTCPIHAYPSMRRHELEVDDHMLRHIKQRWSSIELFSVDISAWLPA